MLNYRNGLLGVVGVFRHYLKSVLVQLTAICFVLFMVQVKKWKMVIDLLHM